MAPASGGIGRDQAAMVKLCRDFRVMKMDPLAEAGESGDEAIVRYRSLLPGNRADGPGDAGAEIRLTAGIESVTADAEAQQRAVGQPIDPGLFSQPQGAKP